MRARATPEATLGKVSEASPDRPWKETAGRGLRAHSHRTCHTPCYADCVWRHRIYAHMITTICGVSTHTDIGMVRNELWSACYP